MKKTSYILAALLVPGAALGNTSGVDIPAQPPFKKADANAYGLQLAQYTEVFDTGWVDQYSKSKMTLVDGRGDTVERAVTQTILEGQDGDKSIVKFMSPAEIRGVAALVHEHPSATDDNWLYLPASRRVRRVSGANRTASFQGTEFTFEDLSTLIVKRYDWKFLGEEEITSDGKKEKVFKLEAKPNYKDTGYAKLIIYLNATKWRGERIDYYDLAGQRLKTLTNSKWTHQHNRFWRASRVEMSNHQTRKKTIIEVSSVFLNLSLYKRKDGSPRANLTDKHFTKRVLEKS
jgi:hypothetical protein